MTGAQFEQICNIIRSGWAFTRFLDSDDLKAQFFNSMNRFPFQVCKDTIIDLIQYGKYETDISMSKILNEIEENAHRNKESEAREAFRKGVKCPVCHDEGYILHRYPTGVEVFRTCDCEAARLKYPWDFRTEEEQKQWEEEEHRKGRHPVKAWRAPADYYRKAYYGEDPERRGAE